MCPMGDWESCQADYPPNGDRTAPGCDVGRAGQLRRFDALGVAGVDRKLRLRVALIFGVFESLIPVVGSCSAARWLMV